MWSFHVIYINSACPSGRCNSWYVFEAVTYSIYFRNLMKMKFEWSLAFVCFPEFHEGRDSHGRGHTSLIVVLVIVAVCMLAAGTFLAYKKSPRLIPTFDNPLYFESDRTQPDVVDTNRLIENAEVENPEPIITLWFVHHILVQNWRCSWMY